MCFVNLRIFGKSAAFLKVRINVILIQFLRQIIGLLYLKKSAMKIFSFNRNLPVLPSHPF